MNIEDLKQWLCDVINENKEFRKALIIFFLLCSACLGYSSLDTSSVFHRDECSSIQGKDPNRIETGSYAEFEAKGKTPCKVCKPTPEAITEPEPIEYIAGFTIFIRRVDNKLFIEVRKNMLQELKDRIPDSHFMRMRDYAQFCTNRFRMYSWPVDTENKVIVSILPLPAGGGIYRPLKPAPAPMSDAEALEILKKLAGE